MQTDPYKSAKREIVVDSDWISAGLMAFLLPIAVLLVVLDFRAVVQGHVRPVSYNTVILALITGFAAVIRDFDKLFRVGAAALAFGAGIRALAYYCHASPSMQQLTGINGLFCSLFAAVIIFIWTVQWFRSSVHLREVGPSQPE